MPLQSNSVRDIEIYVAEQLSAPVLLAKFATADLPTRMKRRIAFDETTGKPAYSDASGTWSDLVAATSSLSGTYTPTLTNVTNVAASTAYQCQYTRVGDVVMVSGKVDVDPTLVAATVLGISLPIDSVLSSAEKCAGIAASNTIASEVAAIDADTVNNRAQLDWVTTSLANHSMFFTFQYLVT